MEQRIEDIRPNDIVVDIGAATGNFVAHAVANNASHIVAVEPNQDYLRTLVETTPNVTAINAGIGSTANHFNNISSKGYKKMSFLDLVVDYNIPKIDYLKIDCEGGEYGIFTEMNFPYLRTQVKNIQVDFHLNSYSGCAKQWQKLRDGLLKKFETVEFLNPDDEAKATDDNFLKAGDFSTLPYFTLLISNS